MKPLIRKTLVSMAVLVMLTVAVNVTQAHHIRGIPHYSYKSNYPETPVYEVVEEVDKWVVTFTYYTIPGQQALDLAIYIRDTLDSEPFEDPVTFRVFGKHEDPDDSHPYIAYRNPTNIYKVGWVYEDAGDYYVRVTFDDEVVQHNVLFVLAVGQENRVWYFLSFSVALIVLFAATVGIIRKKKTTVKERS